MNKAKTTSLETNLSKVLACLNDQFSTKISPYEVPIFKKYKC